MNVSHSPVETELKLLVPPRSIGRLAAHPLLRGRGHAVRQKLYSIYFDTAKLDLCREGVALRLRREGKRWVQTVKGGGTVHGGLHRRVEAEAEVAGPVPDFSRIRDRGLAATFVSRRLRAQLKPVFTTDFTRNSTVLDLDADTRVEASVDQGVIRSGRRLERVSELELELKKGEPHRLYDLALKLARDIPLSIGDRSKAERGYALARGTPEQPVRARPAVLDRAMSVNGAFEAMMWANLAHLQANERGMLAGRDPEYLHQMRVALRRMRSALGVFAPLFPGPVIMPARSELKWLAASLGPARDWDVFLTETLPPVQAAFGAQGILKRFTARCEYLRRAANARARRAVRLPRFRHLMLWFSAWLSSESWLVRSDPAARASLQGAVATFASTVLEERYGRVRKRGHKLGSLSAAELHRLRIAVKKFRYAVDFFAGLYRAKPARDMLRRLARLQDILGAMNDAATVAHLLARGFDDAPGRHVIESKGIVLGWSRGRAATLKRELKGAWKEFRAAERFW